MRTLFPTLTRVRISPQARLQDVAAKGAALYERAERGKPMGPRELSEAFELTQQYIDILKEMETAPLILESGVTADVDGQRVKFPNVDKLADWLAEVMD